VDDDANALETAEQNPRREYGTIYRVMGAAGGQAALYTLAQLKTRPEPVALLTGDQRMPGRPANSHLFEGPHAIGGRWPLKDRRVRSFLSRSHMPCAGWMLPATRMP
jgi:hypothetical protein